MHVGAKGLLSRLLCVSGFLKGVRDQAVRFPGAVVLVEGTARQRPRGGRVFGVNGESGKVRLDGSLWAMGGNLG